MRSGLGESCAVMGTSGDAEKSHGEQGMVGELGGDSRITRG